MSLWRVAQDRIAATGLLVVVFLLVGVSPAFADQAKPTNYKSNVYGVDPPADGASFTITGGDAFMAVTVVPGHTLEVPGYFKEPYIMIDADGSVWLNHDSPAYYINQDRYGNVRAPESADGKGDPEWELVGDGGVYAWQDHRVHWMSFDLPPTVSRDRLQVVFPWEVPVIVDGVESKVGGELVWIPSRSAFPPILAGAVGLLPLVFWDRLKDRSIAALLALAGGLSLVLATIHFGATPATERSLQLAMFLPLVALVLVVGGVLVGRSNKRAVSIAAIGGGLALVTWGLANASTMWLPVLPSTTVPNLQRVGVALVMWVGATLAVVATLRLSFRR